MPEISAVLRNVCAREASTTVLLREAETSMRRGSFCLQHECGMNVRKLCGAGIWEGGYCTARLSVVNRGKALFHKCSVVTGVESLATSCSGRVLKVFWCHQ